MPITKNTPKDDIVHDFVNSTDVKFANDSKKQRIKRALGAYKNMHQESNNIDIEESVVQNTNKLTWPTSGVSDDVLDKVRSYSGIAEPTMTSVESNDHITMSTRLAGWVPAHLTEITKVLPETSGVEDNKKIKAGLEKGSAVKKPLKVRSTFKAIVAAARQAVQEGRHDASNMDREMHISANFPSGGGAPIKNKGIHLEHSSGEKTTHETLGAASAHIKSTLKLGHHVKMFDNGVHVATVHNKAGVLHHEFHD